MKAYCMVFRLHEPSAKQIVGIATSPRGEPRSGEDLVCLDGTRWDEEIEAEAKRLKQELGILTKATRHEFSDSEYPRLPPSWATLNAKGRNRNLQCPCRSGRPVKKCHHD